jgi:hypothetical protein
MTDDFIVDARLPEAEERTRKGGLVIAQSDSEYFRQLAARRKTMAEADRRKNLSRAFLGSLHALGRKNL